MIMTIEDLIAEVTDLIGHYERVFLLLTLLMRIRSRIREE